MKLLPIDIFQIENELESKSLALLQGDALTYLIHRNGTYEKHFLDLINLVIKEGDCAIDMGANLGYHTVSLSKLVGNSGKVIAFEPQRITFQQLNCNIFLNKLDNVYTYNAAVGEEYSEIYIEQVDYYKVVEGYYGTNIGNTSISNNRIGDKVPKITLDSLNLPKCNFIKLDIQGCELLALMGARNTILKHRPILFIEMEIQHLIKFNTTVEYLQQYIFTLGYKILRIDNDYPHDYICIPMDNEILLLNYQHKTSEILDFLRVPRKRSFLKPLVTLIKSLRALKIWLIRR